VGRAVAEVDRGVALAADGDVLLLHRGHGALHRGLHGAGDEGLALLRRRIGRGRGVAAAAGEGHGGCRDEGERRGIEPGHGGVLRSARTRAAFRFRRTRPRPAPGWRRAGTAARWRPAPAAIPAAAAGCGTTAGCPAPGWCGWSAPAAVPGARSWR